MYFQVQVTSVTETRCSHRACMSISDHGTTTCSNLSPEGLRLSFAAGTELDLLRRKSPTHAANTSTPNDTTKTRRGKSTIALPTLSSCFFQPVAVHELSPANKC